MLLDSLHEHLNSPCAVSSSHKLTNGDPNESFNELESSDVNADVDDATCTEVTDKSGETVVSHNEQLLHEANAQGSSGLVDGETDSLQPLKSTLMDSSMMQHCDDSADCKNSVIVDENGRKVPSIEDFCSKDTKTLNTNVLIAEITEELATDSDKFHKIENTSEHCVSTAAESIDDEVTTGDQLHELLLAACDGSVSKPVKETNLVANYRDKFVDSLKMTTYATDVDCFITTMKHFCGKPAGVSELTTEPHDDVQNYDNINNIKRIKIDDQAEKNLRMQVKLKVNTEQNQTRSSSAPLADCTGTHAVSGEQLIASSTSSLAVTVTSDTVQSSASCAADVVTARHVQRAEEAWSAYTSRNRSVIVDTFQGQFKSTVSNAVFPLTYILFMTCLVDKLKQSSIIIVSNINADDCYYCTNDKNISSDFIIKEIASSTVVLDWRMWLLM